MSSGTIRKEASSARTPPVEWSRLLNEAVTKPGIISSAYRRFWNYSVGNQLLAWFQCLERGLELGPINTFMGWKECGRSVKKGAKALTLCMPVEVKCRAKEPADSQADDPIADAQQGTQTLTVFVFKPHWFVLCQTEGREYVPTALAEWDEATALGALRIERVRFDHVDGNCQGFARDRTVAVSPIAFMPHRTFFHEIAHVVLGHTAESSRLEDGDERTPRTVREVEAECVALLCAESLGLAGCEFSRGYIQHWTGREAIPDKSVQRIFKAADQILKAGYPHATSAKSA
jgi:hypothetical protein